MRTTAGIVIGALIISGAILFEFRWEIAATSPGAYRLDRWTGEITWCIPRHEAEAQLMSRVAAPLNCDEETEPQ